MFLIDDLALAPLKAFTWIAKEIQKAADREQEDEADRLTQQLRVLHMKLEAGQLSEEDFDTQEEAILDRLDQLAGDQPEEIDDEDDNDEEIDEHDVDDELVDDEQGDTEDDDQPTDLSDRAA